MNFIFKLFPLFFIGIWLIVIGTFIASGILFVQCYNSNDPNSMACYMLSDKHEIGIRNR